jgi:hypothetical protein
LFLFSSLFLVFYFLSSLLYFFSSFLCSPLFPSFCHFFILSFALCSSSPVFYLKFISHFLVALRCFRTGHWEKCLHPRQEVIGEWRKLFAPKTGSNSRTEKIA